MTGQLKYSRSIPYLAAFIVPALIGVLIWATWPFFQASPLFICLVSVTIASWLGGFRPGLLALIVALLIADFYFLYPFNQFTFPSDDNLFRIYISVGISLVVMITSESMHRARRRAEQNAEAILQGEERFRTTLDNLIEGCQIIDRDWRYIYVNEVAAQQSGKTPKELIGNTMLDTFPALADTEAFALFSKCMDDRVPRQMENQFSAREGEPAWFQLVVQPVPEGLFILSVDITERKQYDDSLRESEKRYRLLFEYNPFPMWVYDVETLKFLDVNDAASHFYGYSRDEFLNMTIKDIRLEQDISALLENVAKTTATINNAGVWKHRKKDGTLVDTEITSHELNFGGSTARLVLANDVTEKKLAEERIKRLNEDLEHRVLKRTAQLSAVNKELEAFSYSVSHDLRAPLRHINGFSQALLEDYSDKLDDQGRSFLNEVCGASQEMAQLIDDVLQLARVTRSEMHSEPIDLSEMAHDITVDLRKGDGRNNVRLDLEEGLDTFGDKRLLHIMLTNLLGNAWKFTGKREDALIAFRKELRDGKSVYVVRDNGAGFDMTYADKLFGTFQRLHTQDEFEGTGIGLATVQRIVNRHGGKVWAEGEIDKGASIYFTLPDIKETRNGD